MNAHSKNGSRGARSRTPKLSLYYYLSATFRIPWNVCEELRPQNLLKMNGIDCDLLGEVRKRSRAFAISWEKIANHRVHLRSLGRRSQTIACICDLLGEERKPSRTFAIGWEKIANRRARFRFNATADGQLLGFFQTGGPALRDVWVFRLADKNFIAPSKAWERGIPCERMKPFDRIQRVKVQSG